MTKYLAVPIIDSADQQLPEPMQKMARALAMQTQTSNAALVAPQVMLSIGRPDLFTDTTLQGAQWVTTVATVGSGNEMISILRRVMPRYPDGAAPRAVRVRVSFNVDENGRVKSMNTVQGANAPLFAFAATSALSQWHFDPVAAQNLQRERFVQTFDFVPPEVDEGVHFDPEPGRDCAILVGSRLCKPLQ
jgi:TonB family protein